MSSRSGRAPQRNAERAGVPDAPVFPTRTGQPLSRDAVAQRLATHVAKAAHACPSLGKKTVTPHTLRHTAAMRLLNAGVDTTVIALWLGHEHVDTTNIYIHADLALKERAIDRTTPAHVRAGRYRPPRHAPGLSRRAVIMQITSAQMQLATAVPAPTSA